MFATSNILLHIDNHKSNPFDLFAPCSIMHDSGSKELKLITVNVNTESLREIFRNSCRIGHLKITKWCISLNVNIHTGSEWALRICCMYGHIDIAKLLVEFGAKIDEICGENCLLICCSEGHIDIVKWLVDLGVNIHANNEMPFKTSCERGHLEIAKWIYSLGVNINHNCSSVFARVCVKGHSDVAKWLVEIYKIPYETIEYCEVEYKMNLIER